MKFTDEIIAPKRLNIYEILKGVIAIKHIQFSRAIAIYRH